MNKKYLDEIEGLFQDWTEVLVRIDKKGKEDLWQFMTEKDRSKLIYRGIVEGNRINLGTQKKAAMSLRDSERIAWLAYFVSIISLGASLISIVTNSF